MTRFITSAIALTATLALAACGDEDSPSTSARATAPPAAGDLERYCALTREMDAAGTKFFARLEESKNATAADFEAAERRFVERFAPQFEEIQRVAPAEIRPTSRPCSPASAGAPVWAGRSARRRPAPPSGASCATSGGTAADRRTPRVRSASAADAGWLCGERGRSGRS
jgi:hypothetical protein